MLSPGLKALAIKEAWNNGNLRYMLRPSQRILYDAGLATKSKSRKFVFCCGRGWGKSFFLFASCVETALRHPGSDSVFVAPVQRKVAEYLEPIARAAFLDCPERIKPVFRTADLVYKFPNGSRIMVCGSNQKSFD